MYEPTRPTIESCGRCQIHNRHAPPQPPPQPNPHPPTHLPAAELRARQPRLPQVLQQRHLGGRVLQGPPLSVHVEEHLRLPLAPLGRRCMAGVLLLRRPRGRAVAVAVARGVVRACSGELCVGGGSAGR